jgi:hypothetical protein
MNTYCVPCTKTKDRVTRTPLKTEGELMKSYFADREFMNEEFTHNELVHGTRYTVCVHADVSSYVSNTVKKFLLILLICYF